MNETKKYDDWRDYEKVNNHLERKRDYAWRKAGQLRNKYPNRKPDGTRNDYIGDDYYEKKRHTQRLDNMIARLKVANTGPSNLDAAEMRRFGPNARLERGHGLKPLRKPKLDESNQREAAKAGVYVASRKHGAPKVGQDVDFYHPTTGDKTYGVVTHSNGKTITIKSSKDGKFAGKSHRFNVKYDLDESKKPKIDSAIARELLARHGNKSDYFLLHSSDANDLASAAVEHGYRKSRTSPASLGRAFHSYLLKKAKRLDESGEFGYHPDHKLDEANSPKTAAIKAKYHRGRSLEI